MMHRVTWYGTTDECLALLDAVRRHCCCRVDGARLVSPCPGHTLLARDQRAVDGLLFMRRMADRLRAEEFLLADTAARSRAALTAPRP